MSCNSAASDMQGESVKRISAPIACLMRPELTILIIFGTDLSRIAGVFAVGQLKRNDFSVTLEQRD
jgi:hypothetical protein